MTPAHEDLHCCFYRSNIAADADVSCVASIVKTARHFNTTQGITGILVFDGQQFCQYLEGPQPALQALVNRIAADPRHTAFTILYQGSTLTQRRFHHWSMAYVQIEDDEAPLEHLMLQQGPDAIQQLEAMIPQLDLA